MPDLTYTAGAARALRRLARAEPATATRLREKIERFAAAPTADYPWARPLTGRPAVRLRQGDYRAIVEVRDGPPTVLMVVNVGHRREVYR